MRQAKQSDATILHDPAILTAKAVTPMTATEVLFDAFELFDAYAAPHQIESHWDAVVNQAIQLDTPDGLPPEG